MIVLYGVKRLDELVVKFVECERIFFVVFKVLNENELINGFRKFVEKIEKEF